VTRAIISCGSTIGSNGRHGEWPRVRAGTVTTTMKVEAEGDREGSRLANGNGTAENHGAIPETLRSVKEGWKKSRVSKSELRSAAVMVSS